MFTMYLFSILTLLTVVLGTVAVVKPSLFKLRNRPQAFWVAILTLTAFSQLAAMSLDVINTGMAFAGLLGITTLIFILGLIYPPLIGSKKRQRVFYRLGVPFAVLIVLTLSFITTVEPNHKLYANLQVLAMLAWIVLLFAVIKPSFICLKNRKQALVRVFIPALVLQLAAMGSAQFMDSADVTYKVLSDDMGQQGRMVAVQTPDRISQTQLKTLGQEVVADSPDGINTIIMITLPQEKLSAPLLWAQYIESPEGQVMASINEVSPQQLSIIKGIQLPTPPELMDARLIGSWFLEAAPLMHLNIYQRQDDTYALQAAVMGKMQPVQSLDVLGRSANGDKPTVFTVGEGDAETTLRIDPDLSLFMATSNQEFRASPANWHVARTFAHLAF